MTHPGDVLDLVDVVMDDDDDTVWHLRLPTPEAGSDCLMRFRTAAGLPLPVGGDTGVTLASKGEDTDVHFANMD